ncbi:MAG: DUF362 domain-containing protein [Sedimentisphaerales bacterium]|jgi:uncharacterized Fe-S center protein
MIPKVYFIKSAIEEGEKIISAKAARLFKEAGFAKCFKPTDFTAVKIHVGEKGNKTYIKAPCLKGLIDELISLKTKPFLTDTSTLYLGKRHNAIDHAILAYEHGFDMAGLGIPFIPPDGIFGTSETVVKIEGELNKEVSIAYDIARAQSILAVSHVTGHIGTCFAATLKTLGMGCASRKGKMRQHAAFKPSVDMSKCVGCGECYRHCPEAAINIEDLKAHIIKDKCVGCAECLAVCRFGAVQHDWDKNIKILECSIAEHAKGVLAGKDGRAAFINFAISITSDCDCMGNPDNDIVKDIGILGSTDPVAVDAAAIDLMEKTAGKPLDKISKYPNLNGKWQIEHAEKIGLGSRKYNLIEIV